jgi:Arc/MetJ-type ribon-helix-helix transcriptional regulator
VAVFAEKYMNSKCTTFILTRGERMDEVITSRFPEIVTKKVEKAVSRGIFKNRSEALRKITEEYLKEHPELFLGDKIQELIGNAPDFTDDELEQLGAKIFKGVNISAH